MPPEGVLFHIDGNMTEMAHDQELSYTCSRGFDSVFDDNLQTFPTIQCAGGIWEGETPSCEGKVYLIICNTCLTFCLNDTVILIMYPEAFILLINIITVHTYITEIRLVSMAHQNVCALLCTLIIKCSVHGTH